MATLALPMRRAAEALSVPYSTFRRLYYSGGLPFPGLKFGGKVLFSAADINRWLSGELPAPVEPAPAAEAPPKRRRGRPHKLSLTPPVKK